MRQSSQNLFPVLEVNLTPFLFEPTETRITSLPVRE